MNSIDRLFGGRNGASDQTGNPVDNECRRGSSHEAIPEGQQVWATNAPSHWPAVVAPTKLNSMGLGDEVTADPFQSAAFAVQLLECFSNGSGTCALSEILPKQFGERIDFLIEDAGASIPVVLYPQGGLEAALHFRELTQRMRSNGQPDPVYFAPQRFDTVMPSQAAFDVRTDNLLPRVVSSDFVRKFPADAGLINRPLGSTGLREVLVLDGEQSVAFVTQSMLDGFHLSADAAFEVALKNLQPKLLEGVVRGVLERNELTMNKYGDSFDAARVLAVPALLREGEAVAALIPDRDTLVLLAAPKEKDTPEFWESLANFPGSGDGGPPISNRPLRVTRQGIELR